MTPVDRMVRAGDGLRLHVRDWAPPHPRGAPVVCLPGLARTAEDFEDLALHLASETGGSRRVIAISARGRGESDRDPDPGRYRMDVEAADALLVLDALSVSGPFLVGTSRGGLQAMTIAAIRTGFWRAAVLNDVGPVLEARGLRRIRDQISRAGRPRDWRAAEEQTAALNRAFFPSLTETDFARWARRTWREGADGLEPTCDPALARIFVGLDLDQPLPALWALFDALAGTPTMVVRGALSDVLSASAVSEMRTRRSDLAVHEVPDQGHAPLLGDRPTMEAIARFFDSAERRG
jgi:pimeloyl-ACP methyl ester carboxylesterase